MADKPKKQKGKLSPLMLKVMARFGEVEFREAYIPNSEDGRCVHGLWEEDGTITINPIPEVVNTIIHELLHEMFPEYSEHAVRTLTGKLWRELDEEQRQTVYEEWKRRAQLSERLQKIENEKFDLA